MSAIKVNQDTDNNKYIYIYIVMITQWQHCEKDWQSFRGLNQLRLLVAEVESNKQHSDLLPCP
jgi:hypothetical protein